MTLSSFMLITLPFSFVKEKKHPRDFIKRIEASNFTSGQERSRAVTSGHERSLHVLFDRITDNDLHVN